MNKLEKMMKLTEIIGVSILPEAAQELILALTFAINDLEKSEKRAAKTIVAINMAVETIYRSELACEYCIFDYCGSQVDCRAGIMGRLMDDVKS